jgi:hypothetical protein
MLHVSTMALGITTIKTMILGITIMNTKQLSIMLSVAIKLFIVSVIELSVLSTGSHAKIGVKILKIMQIVVYIGS